MSEVVNNKTIVHLTSEHWHFDGRIFHKEAKTLAENYNTVVLSGISSVPMDYDRNVYPEGRYEGVLCLSCDLKKEKPTLLRRVLKKLKLKKGWGYKKYFKHFACKLDKEGIKPDLIIIHDEVLLDIVVSLKSKYKCPVLFDCHEHYYFYEFEKYYKKGNISKIGAILKHWGKAISRIDGIISAAKTMDSLNYLVNNSMPGIVIQNKTLFNEESKRSGDKIKLVHEGHMFFSRGLKEIFKIYSDQWFLENTELKIIGSLKGEELKYYNAEISYNPDLAKCILSTGWVHYNYLAENIKGSDIGVIFLEKRLNSYYSLPNKLYNYIGMGLPVLSFDMPDINHIIREYDIGLIVERNPESIKKGILKIIENYEHYVNNIKKYKDLFLWDSEKTKYIDFVSSFLKNHVSL